MNLPGSSQVSALDQTSVGREHSRSLIDEQRMIVVNAEQFYRDLQVIDPLMGRLVLPIEIEHRDGQPGGLQDPMNLFQRPGNVSIVIKRLHRKGMSEFTVVERKLLGAGHFKVNIRS